MKMIIFLGNPGLQYRKTRHNIGFMLGDLYARNHHAKWKNMSKFGAMVAEMTLDGKRNFLVKPQLFYNRAGESVQKLSHFYKIPTNDILVICDDLNLEFGNLRYRERGSDGGNNGIKSIVSSLGSDNFARLRIGTNNTLRDKMDDADFVLSKFTRAEQGKLSAIYDGVATKIDEFIHKN